MEVFNEEKQKDRRKHRRHSERVSALVGERKHENDEQGSTLNPRAREKRRTVQRMMSEPAYQTSNSVPSDLMNDEREDEHADRFLRTSPSVSASLKKQSIQRRKSSGYLKTSDLKEFIQKEGPSQSFHLSSDFVASHVASVRSVEAGSDSVDVDSCDISEIENQESFSKTSKDIEENRKSIGAKLRDLIQKLTLKRIQKLEVIDSLKTDMNMLRKANDKTRSNLAHHVDTLFRNASKDMEEKCNQATETLNTEKIKIDYYINKLTKLCERVDVSRLHGEPPTAIAEKVKLAEQRYDEITADALLQQDCSKLLELKFLPSPALSHFQTITAAGKVELESHINNATAKLTDREVSCWCSGDEMTKTCITGMACLKDGKLVLADNSNKSLKLFDSEFKPLAKYKLTTPPWSVALATGNKILVTLPELRQFCQFRIENKEFKKELTMETEAECLGIADFGDEIIISTYDGSTAELIGISQHGGVLRKRSTFYDQVSKKNCFLKRPNFLQISNDFKVLLISDVDKGLYGISASDLYTVHFHYNHVELRGPLGVDVDFSGHIYICGMYSHNIHQLTKKGNLCRILSTKHLTPNPQCVCFSRHANALIVSLDEQYDMKVLQFS